jgi:hypothetical protein
MKHEREQAPSMTEHRTVCDLDVAAALQVTGGVLDVNDAFDSFVVRQNLMLIRLPRIACVLITAGLLTAACSSAIPAPASATPTPGLGDALRQELGTLQGCLEGSTSSLSASDSICYQGFSYTLDGYTWPAPVTQGVAALRAAGLALATCLSGSAPSGCSADLAAFGTARDQLLGALP